MWKVSPISFLIGWVKRSDVLCLVSCDHTEVDIATRALRGRGEAGSQLGAPAGDLSYQVIEDPRSNGITNKLHGFLPLDEGTQ